MFIRVSGTGFHNSIMKLVPTSGRTLINFKVTGKVLTIQLIGNIITENSVDIDERDNSADLDITVSVTPAILLVNKDEMVDINILPDVLSIRQQNYSFEATREWESRFELPQWDDSIAEPFDEKEFVDIVRSVRNLDAIANVTKQPLSNITFYNKSVYCLYSNVLLRRSTSIGDFTLTSETARNLQRLLDVQCKYVVNREKGYIFIKTKYKFIYALTQPVDVQTVSAMDKKLSECKHLTDVSLSGMSEDIDTLVRVYKNGKVVFNITDNSLSLLITDGKNTFTYGSRQLPKASMKFTISHLNSINKMFYGSSDIKASTGGNVLCLNLNSLMLLISGTLF